MQTAIQSEGSSIKSESSNIKIELSEAESLRSGIRNEHAKRGGVLNLGGATQKIYVNLADDFKVKFSELMLVISYTTSNNNEVTIDSPGHGFLKDLFYDKKDKPQMSACQYNIDMCYQYAFGKTRKDYQQTNSNRTNYNHLSTSEAIFKNKKVIVSCIQFDVTTAENLKNYLRSTFFSDVIIDVRDVSFLCQGTLSEMYKENNILIFFILSKSFFLHHKSIAELLELKKQITLKVSLQTLFIGLDDINDGEYNLHGNGKFKIIDYWLHENSKLEKLIPITNRAIKKKPNDTSYISQAEGEILNNSKIINELPLFINFMFEEATFSPYQLFITHFKAEQFKIFFDKQKLKSSKKR
jgi:hypothetical protein